MIKRANKITALLVAMISIMSTTPAIAKAERLTETEGEIDSIVAFKDGKYIYEGFKKDNEHGVYYNDGVNETLLDDVDDLDTAIKYGDSYIVFPDSKEEYRVDLNTGKVITDGNTRENDLIMAKNKLKTKLSKTKRYDKDTKILSFKEISADTNMFGNDQWYEYTATGNSYYVDNLDDKDDVDEGGDSGENESEPKSQITVTIKGIWGPCTIAGVPFSNIYDVSSLEKSIKNTTFTGYTVKSTSISNDSGSDVLTIIFTTNEDLKDVVPNGFITGLSDWSNGYAESIASEYVSDNGNELKPKSKITVTIQGIWGPCTIAGVPFSNIYDVSSLEKAIKNTTFTGYTVKSTSISNNSGSDVLTVIFTTNEDLKDAVPNGFVTGLSDWSNGYAESVASEYVSDDGNGDDLDSGNEDDLNGDNGDGQDQEEKVVYYGYTDGKGNYIDCSKIANLKVFNGENAVKFEKFNDKKVIESNIDGKKLKVKVGLPIIEATLGQDDNYIYSLVSVPIVGAQPENGSSYKPEAETKLKYVQKISKKQQEKENGAYLPSSVDSYQMNNNTGWDEGDNWAYMAAYYMIEASLNEFGDNRGIRIIDENIYVAHSTTDDNDDPSVSFGKIKLKKSSKVYLLDEDRTITEPLVFEDYANAGKAEAWTIDANANVWSIFEGKIRKSEQGNEFQELYKCDRDMNRLEVYDENNLMAWEDGGEYYVTSNDISINSDKLQATTYIKTGWQKAEDGTWSLYDLYGNKTKGWISYSSCWYYFSDEGVMKTGWVNYNGKFYYLDNSGAMKTGWIKIEDNWYYLDQSGARQQNTTINDYLLDENGVWIK